MICKPYNATIPETTCIARQKILHKKNNRKAWANGGNVNFEKCVNCEVGKALYQKSLKGELPKMEKPETKVCPCGKEFARMPDQSDLSWSRVKYCPEHAQMNSYQRDKALLKFTGTKTFTCAICGKELPLDLEHFHKNGSTATGYNTACRSCRNEQKRARRARAKSSPFSLKTAREIAHAVASAEIDYVSGLMDADEATLKRLRLIAERVGVECQRRMVGAA